MLCHNNLLSPSSQPYIFNLIVNKRESIRVILGGVLLVLFVSETRDQGGKALVNVRSSLYILFAHLVSRCENDELVSVNCKDKRARHALMRPRPFNLRRVTAADRYFLLVYCRFLLHFIIS